MQNKYSEDIKKLAVNLHVKNKLTSEAISKVTPMSVSYIDNLLTEYWKSKETGFKIEYKSNQEVVIAPKIYSEDIYFIYRQNGQEVRVDTSGSYPVASKKLTVKEINYINDNILNI